jgi:hypothetical protein
MSNAEAVHGRMARYKRWCNEEIAFQVFDVIRWRLLLEVVRFSSTPPQWQDGLTELLEVEQLFLSSRYKCSLSIFAYQSQSKSVVSEREEAYVVPGPS